MAVTAASDAFTVEDLEAMPDDGRRYELIGGAIVMTPAPAPVHQLVSLRLEQLLGPLVPAGYQLFHAPIDLDLHGGSRVQPDVVVVPPASIGDRRLTLPVVLVVEIVSAGSRANDHVTKRAAYAASAIPAYWLVDLTERRISCLALEGDAYRPVADGPRVTVEAPLAGPVTLDIDQLMAGPAPAGEPAPTPGSTIRRP